MPVDRFLRFSGAIDSGGLDSIGRAGTTHQYTPLGSGIRIGDWRFRHELLIESAEIGSWYYVHLPLEGHLRYRYGGKDLVAFRSVAGVYRPGDGPFFGRWTAGTRSLCVAIAPDLVDTAITTLMEQQPSRPVRLAPTVSVRDAAPRAWINMLMSLKRQLDHADLLAHPLMTAPLSETLVNGFVLATWHRNADVTATATPLPGRSAVDLAVDLIENAPHDPWTVSGLAAACSVSVRSLQSGFRKRFGTTPMAYLRDTRLRRVHEDLCAAAPDTDSVASVARRWGFGHLGRFAAAYEAKYEEKPLATLRSPW